MQEGERCRRRWQEVRLTVFAVFSFVIIVNSLVPLDGAPAPVSALPAPDDSSGKSVRCGFGFLHIPKTGGETIEAALGLTKRHTPYPYLEKPASAYQHTIGSPACKPSCAYPCPCNKYPAENRSCFKTFTVVRNPFDRMYSFYRFCRTKYHGGPHYPAHGFCQAAWQTSFPDFIKAVFVDNPETLAWSKAKLVSPADNVMPSPKRLEQIEGIRAKRRADIRSKISQLNATSQRLAAELAELTSLQSPPQPRILSRSANLRALQARMRELEESLAKVQLVNVPSHDLSHPSVYGEWKITDSMAFFLRSGSGHIVADYIARFEHFEEDLQAIFHDLGLHNVQIGHKNAAISSAEIRKQLPLHAARQDAQLSAQGTERSGEGAMEGSEVGVAEPAYRAAYTPEARRIVETVFREDLEIFNYSF